MPMTSAVSAALFPPLGRWLVPTLEALTLEAVLSLTGAQSPKACSQFQLECLLSALLIGSLGAHLYALPLRGSKPFKGRACSITSACYLGEVWVGE